MVLETILEFGSRNVFLGFNGASIIMLIVFLLLIHVTLRKTKKPKI